MSGATASAQVAAPAGWKVLGQPTLPADPGGIPSTLSYAMLRADLGVALLDVAPAVTANAVLRFRQALGRVGFETIYPGYLPVIYVQIDAWKPLAVERMLETALRAEPRLSCDDPSWTDMAARVLTGRTAEVPPLVPPRARDRMEIVTSSPPLPHASRQAKTVAGLGLAVAVAGSTALIAYKTDPDAVVQTVQHLAPNAPAPPQQVQTPAPPPAPEPAAAPEAIVVAPADEPAPAPPMPDPPAASTTQPPPPPAEVVVVPSPPHPAGDVTAANAIARADALMRQHNIEDARSWYARAYRAGDGTAAVSLGMSFDPFFLVEIGEQALANQREALAWYDKARAIGGERVTTMLRFVEARRSRKR